VNLLTRVDSTHGNAKDSATFAVGDRVTSWLGASYTYDADGNRATRTVGSTVTTYMWDAGGRLLQVKTGTDSVTYAYNALGDLARRSTKGRVDRWFVWEEGQLLEELDSTAQHRVNAFAYLPGTDAPLARITGDAASTIEFVQQDGRGDVIGLTTGANMTQHVLYGAWGDVEAVSGDSLPQTRLGWKVLVWEGGTAQLYYVRSRWYDPQSGSFLSEDPLGLSGGRNTYAYADNDPVNGWDPSGMYVFLCRPREVWVPSYGYYGSDGYDIIGGHWETDGQECAMSGSGFGNGLPADYPTIGAPTRWYMGGGGGGSGANSKLKALASRIKFTPTKDCVAKGAFAVASAALEFVGAGELKGAAVGLVKAGVPFLKSEGLSLLRTLALSNGAENAGIRLEGRAAGYFGAIAAAHFDPALNALAHDEAKDFVLSHASPDGFSWWDLVPLVGTYRAAKSAVKACVSVR
jgi:RHS repeat-associated protein